MIGLQSRNKSINTSNLLTIIPTKTISNLPESLVWNVGTMRQAKKTIKQRRYCNLVFIVLIFECTNLVLTKGIKVLVVKVQRCYHNRIE